MELGCKQCWFLLAKKKKKSLLHTKVNKYSWAFIQFFKSELRLRVWCALIYLPRKAVQCSPMYLQQIDSVLTHLSFILEVFTLSLVGHQLLCLWSSRYHPGKYLDGILKQATGTSPHSFSFQHTQSHFDFMLNNPSTPLPFSSLIVGVFMVIWTT